MAAAQTLDEVNAVLGTVSVAMPQFFAIYNAIKLIWTVANPGKTDADFNTFLLTQANKTTSDADAILMSKGFIRDPATGIWNKPTPTITTVA